MNSTTSDKRPYIVSISLFLPFDGVDHAGGALLLRHYKILADRCARLDAYAVDFDENVTAAFRAGDINACSYKPFVLVFPRWRRSLLGKIIARIWFVLLPLLPDIGILGAFWSSKALRHSLRQADIVELQWYEYFYFARLVKQINPSVRIVGYAHDIPSQKWERRLSAWPQSLQRTYLAHIRWLERKLLHGIDRVMVLSAKDADLLAKHGASDDVTVLDPPLDLKPSKCMGTVETTVTSSSCQATATFGFIGAFHRPENDDAAMWLLSAIWPSVIHRCPSAHLYLVGSKPSRAVEAAADAFGDSVTVTGYVDDVDSYYDLMSTVVIPLRFGAGVKFKTISAILAEKNIVATSVAVEGTLPADQFFRVSDSADQLADAMVELAINPNAGHDIIAKARAQVGSRYSLNAYAQAVHNAYQLDADPGS